MTLMDMTMILCRLSLAAYLVSTLVYTASLLIRRVHTARIATWIFTAAFATHTFTFIAAWIERGHSPVLTIHDGLSFFAWVMAGTYLIFQLRTKTRVLGAFISPVSFVFLTMASPGLGGAVVIPGILKNGLVALHAMISVIGEALFAVASLAGLMYLIQDNLIKRKKNSRFIKYLPPLRDLDRINHACLLWGFPLLTFGILAGSIWARVAWGSHWQWEPKLLWASAAWVVYALLLHQRLAIGWKGRKAALFSVIAFVLLLFAFVMERAFFTTMHSFF
jgi:cytochrome c-type biogenesis protein CcsB